MPANNGEKKSKPKDCATGFIPSALAPQYCSTCSQTREKHKTARVRAVIVITENENDARKFNASLNFEPSIQDKKNPGTIAQWALEHIVCKTAWYVWDALKAQQKNFVVVTDDK